MVMAMKETIHSLIRGYVLDLLPLPLPRSTAYSEVVISACRLLGCATVLATTDISIRHAGTIPTSQIIPFGLFVVAVALLVGNLIKEVAILIGSMAMNRLGLDFRRTRLTLNGAQIREVYRPDGTWDQYILETPEIIHEWSDLDGECHREVLASDAPDADLAHSD